MKLLKHEFIFTDPTPTPECHASTIAVFDDNRAAAAWFAGTREGEEDVLIWSSLYKDGKWSTPKAISPEKWIQHWNPVLFKASEEELILFYKIGTPIPDWKTMYMTSFDGGNTWDEPKEVVAGDESGGRGPVKNKPIRISDGKVLAPASVERGPWRCFIDMYDGESWTKKTIPVECDAPEKVNVIQPALWESPKGCIHALMRSNQGKIYRADSSDHGETWSSIYPIDIPNNNSGIDAVMTENGTVVLVCNPVEKDWGMRSPLSVYTSDDNGETFVKQLDLETEAGEFSYPTVTSLKNKVYITYTYNRKKIRFAELEL